MRLRAEGKTCLALRPIRAVRKLARAFSIYAIALVAGFVVFVPPADSQACALSSLHSDAASCALEADSGLIANADDKTFPYVDEDPPSSEGSHSGKAADFNRDIFYGGKLEFALDAGWLPLNIPFPFDFIEGDPYQLYPLRYTLVPVVASLRWHFTNLDGPWFLRGDWDTTFSLSATAIPKGAETHYFSYDMGVRRNFVPRNWRVTPYWDVRCGLGIINAKGPLGVYFAQGQNFTFNLNMGAGARYNFSPRYAISAGLNWMHISNANLSAPAYSNYGINVYGPMLGLDIQLRRHARHTQSQ
jgi:hypothetical protein